MRGEFLGLISDQDLEKLLTMRIWPACGDLRTCCQRSCTRLEKGGYPELFDHNHEEVVFIGARIVSPSGEKPCEGARGSEIESEEYIGENLAMLHTKSFPTQWYSSIFLVGGLSLSIVLKSATATY
jgi:hypothetical protein